MCFIKCKVIVVTVLLGYLCVVKAQQFTVQPESVAQAEGLEAVFECLYPGADGYAWFINDSGANLLTSPPGIDVIEGPGDGVSVIILATSEYNSSVVLCEAQVGFGSLAMFFRSKNTTLEVYGVGITATSGVNTITLRWTDRFTTNVTYCVEINQTVLGSTETVPLDPVCGLTGTQYKFNRSGNYSMCDRFSFTVTPTEGGRRGTSSQPVTGFFTQARGEGGSTIVNRGEDQTVKRVTFDGMVPNCTTYTSFQVDSDILIEPIRRFIPDLQPFTFSLPTDKVTEVTVTLTDINGIDLVFENIPTNTFDIQDLIINKLSGGGGINVSVVFVGGSQSPGALVCVMPILTDGSLDFNNMTLTTIPQDRSESVDITVPTGTYRLFAFDLESNGLPRMPISVAADNETVDVTAGTGGEAPLLIDVGVNVSMLPNGNISVTCPDVSLNCLVLVKSTTDSTDRVNVGHINTSNRTVVLSPGATDVFVAVYTWNSIESIFTGKLSLISQLKVPASTTMDGTTTSDMQPTDESTTYLLSINPGMIAGIVVFFLVVIAVAMVIVATVYSKNTHSRRQQAIRK